MCFLVLDRVSIFCSYHLPLPFETSVCGDVDPAKSGSMYRTINMLDNR